MRISILKAGLLLGLLAGSLAPALAHADDLSLNVNLGADDQAHFDFADRHRHDPMILKAARQLQAAKHSLWRARNDFNGHKRAAIEAINRALDELSLAEQPQVRRRDDGRGDDGRDDDRGHGDQGGDHDDD